MFSVFLLAALLSVVVAKNNGLGMTPPMGWNTWCTLGRCGRDFCNEAEILAVADAMEKNGMKEAGYTYINLDDCWADVRDANGNILPDQNRFPRGMAPLIKDLNSKGFKFGLYTDSGLTTCSRGERDHSIPGSYGHYIQDAATYAEWGVEYVKMDWCSTKVNGIQLDPHVVYRNMSIAIDKTKKPIWLNSCEWGVDQPWEWMREYANSWRTGKDHHDDWSNTADIIEINANLSSFAGPGGWNDPDFIYTGGQGCDPPVDEVHCPGMTDVEYRTEFTLWSVLAAPLLVATDIRNMTDLMKEILLNKELIAINQDSLGHAGGRVGFYTSLLGCQGTQCQIWAKTLKDGSKALVLYNSGESSQKIEVDFRKFFKWSSVNMRDVWTHKDMGVVKDSFSVTVKSHGVEAYRIRSA